MLVLSLTVQRIEVGVGSITNSAEEKKTEAGVGSISNSAEDRGWCWFYL